MSKDKIADQVDTGDDEAEDIPGLWRYLPRKGTPVIHSTRKVTIHQSTRREGESDEQA